MKENPVEELKRYVDNYEFHAVLAELNKIGDENMPCEVCHKETKRRNLQIMYGVYTVWRPLACIECMETF